MCKVWCWRWLFGNKMPISLQDFAPIEDPDGNYSTGESRPLFPGHLCRYSSPATYAVTRPLVA